MKTFDVIIIGAGAAGLMCAIEAGKRGRTTLILDHANKVGKKILMSGGGRCNFTNYHISPERFISSNPHFCKSALSRYTQWDFIDLVKRHQIPFHEKTLGQLFCDNKSKDIVDMLLLECERAEVDICLNTSIETLNKISDSHFVLKTSRGEYHCESLVIASGGLSIPTMGASSFGYKMAEQFGLNVLPTRAGLVPLTLHTKDKEALSVLSGIALLTDVSYEKTHFKENMLFTHRGISGPAILQISSYWQPGNDILINMLPNIDIADWITMQKRLHPAKQLKTLLTELLPKRVIDIFLNHALSEKTMGSISANDIDEISHLFQQWQLKPNGTEGYRTAEVTLGGVDCHALSSKTMAVNDIQGLYFIGEVVDVSGWLGGYNFQWAWSSGWAAGQVV